MKDAPSEPVATLYRPVGEQELDLIRASGGGLFLRASPSSRSSTRFSVRTTPFRLHATGTLAMAGRVPFFDFRLRPNTLHNFPSKPQVPANIGSIGFRPKNWKSSTATSSV